MKLPDFLLKEYVYNNIIPQYSVFDKGHNIDHIRDAIENSLEIALTYDVDINMVFIVAAYHDIGIKYGRKNHNITSAEFMVNDKNLKKWFIDEQIEIMSDAIIDHRASNNYEPRTIYGKIISEADRVIDAEKIIYRTMEYGKTHSPGLTYEEHVERTYQHLQEKYGKNGYMKLWLNTTRNVEGLRKLREMLEDKSKIKEICSSFST